MRVFFLRVCCALIFFQTLARSRFIGLRWGCARPAAARLLAQHCDVCDGELRESNPRPRAPEARIMPLDQAPRHIMAACDAGAHTPPRFCGRCPRALVKSLMVALRHAVLAVCLAPQPARFSSRTFLSDKELAPSPSSSTDMGVSSTSSQGILTRWCGVFGLLVPRAITHYSGRRRMRAGGGRGVRSGREVLAPLGIGSAA